ncbi:PREDICTED: saccharopine dehydrogenase-like oxidoreductase [Drosophila arizonae]|uniref:Saccharopine dehydrogenase-like oxidoreductase n=1 Tax=Drosophila arizonae TaxID=7263 RepID=A0ABM1Q0B9_DROAR|nr:PREDICTED: saccharopine dehydrogenase-like oxidoreductase [Drosophila arizonae]XP_017872889.1 PREDICTED: saccharopine dehydrogenase-like oxidoreductase [Drosophila arizonae]XP_017872897.1 PREDICTED: saccharopine dehydrogenase-like oxidoreductase [Drosophila arizonae]XP_017872905.1 PREDICTED: saccharopine dehydrogenase-like oxidoreductase [Drosophila arizonae]XP_017872913.1 PREDICTED: saccharopine dehydrogenase-like oxidoreductase [Drosophila arizonae]
MATERLDVIIFGASGFTGKYTVYEAVSVLKDLKWGIAGRNRAKLQEVLKEMGAKAKKDLSQTPIFIADVNDEASLLNMAKSCRIVVNTAGPYRFFGENVVRACINAGTHHVDVSGEPQYMETMQLKYNELAKERGVYVISACGFDSIPADMGIVFVEKNFDGVVNSVETFLVSGIKDENNASDSKAGLNTGTWQSAVYGLAHADELRGIRQKLYPERLPKFFPILKHRPLIFRSREINKVCLPFPGSDRSVVMRSQRFLYDTEKKRPVQMHAYIGFSSWLAAIFVALFATIFALMAKFEFGRTLLLKYPSFFSGGFVSPEGPSESRMERSFFKMTMKATGWPSSQRLAEGTDQYTEPPTKTLMVRVSGPNPGYGSTCVALLSTAVTILRESNKMPGNGGVLPPGAAFSKTSLISELEKHEHGIKFEILANK